MEPGLTFLVCVANHHLKIVVQPGLHFVVSDVVDFLVSWAVRKQRLKVKGNRTKVGMGCCSQASCFPLVGLHPKTILLLSGPPGHEEIHRSYLTYVYFYRCLNICKYVHIYLYIYIYVCDFTFRLICIYLLVNLAKRLLFIQAARVKKSWLFARPSIICHHYGKPSYWDQLHHHLKQWMILHGRRLWLLQHPKATFTSC